MDQAEDINSKTHAKWKKASMTSFTVKDVKDVKG